jgi:type IV pilus assembly protein PilM
MSILSGISVFFGLDIGTTAVRLVELRGSGSTKVLAKYAYVNLPIGLSQSDSKSDQQKLGEIIRNLVQQAKVGTRNVAVGLPSGRVFTTVVDIDRLTPDELAKSIRYQADSLIPTPLETSKMDWALLGDSPKDKSKIEVILTSVPNDFIERQLDMLELIGLNVIAFEPDSLALTRALVLPSTAAPHMVLDVGYRSTDLVICMQGGPRLTRSIPTGSEALVRAAAQSLNIDEKQAQQFVFKFGVSKDKLEGQIYNAIINNVDVLITEIDKSIKFFEDRYQGSKIDKIVVTGAASALPEFPVYVANKFGVNVEIGNAWRNIAFPASRQNELLTVSNQMGVAAGLAERSE